MVVIFILLFVGSYAQESCTRLQHGEYQHNVVFFEDFTGKGGSAGAMAVGGKANLEQFSAGGSLANTADYALLVGGQLSIQCGDFHSNVFHVTTVDVGARVNWFGYSTAQVGGGTVYSFNEAKPFYEGISDTLIEIAESAAAAVLTGDTLRISGSASHTTNIVSVQCSDLAGARKLEFSNIKSDDTTSVIINVMGAGPCSIGFDIQGVSGLSFGEPTGHILWNFQTDTLEITGGVVGSILAPFADLKSVGKSYVTGQVIAKSGNGEFYFGANLFRGCVPIDTCFLLQRDCPAAEIPVPCIRPELIDSSTDQCCKVYKCLEDCSSVPCVASTILCEGDFFPVPIAPVVNGGDPTKADDCCERMECRVDRSGITQYPVVSYCPPDLDVRIKVGMTHYVFPFNNAQLEPIFYFADAMTSKNIKRLNRNGEHILPEGSHVFDWSANGFGSFQNTTIGCYQVIKVRKSSLQLNCIVGGVEYENGAQAVDDCAQSCTCIDGAMVNCKRVRYELQSLSQDERAWYWRIYKQTYNHNDGILKQLVDNHVQFFSRGLHNNGAFLPWHRGYILEWENRLRIQDCRATVPYWNWARHTRISTSVIFGDELHQASGTGDNRRCVQTGTFGFLNGFRLTNGRCMARRISGSSAASEVSIRDRLLNRYAEASQFNQFRNRLEHGPGLHDSIHCLVGGTMCSARSSNDPVFFSHHAHLDAIWDKWQQKSDAHLNAYEGNTDLNALMPTSLYTPNDMLNLLQMRDGGSITSVIYHDGTDDFLEEMLRDFNSNDFASVGHAAVGQTDSTWFEAMNMAEEDQGVIRLAEQLHDDTAVAEIVALTLANAGERTMETPGLEAAIKAVSLRMARSASIISISDPLLLFQSLIEVFVDKDLVPGFFEIRDLLLTSDEGEVVDIVSTPVPIVCAVVNIPVCSERGITFDSPCLAEQSGESMWTQGVCTPPEIQPALSPLIDGSASLEYGHNIQELSVCPETLPESRSQCPLERVTCFYGIECFGVYLYTITCTKELVWGIQKADWDNCVEAERLQSPSEEVQVISTNAPTAVVTRSPTRAPTSSPTRAPTSSPTRAARRSVGRTPSRTPPQTVRRSVGRTPARSPPFSVRTQVSNRFTQTTNINRSPPRTPPRRVISNPVCPVQDCPPVAPRCCSPGQTLVRPDIRDSAGTVCAQGCLGCQDGAGNMQRPPSCCTGALFVCPSQSNFEEENQCRSIVDIPRNSNLGAPCCDTFKCINSCDDVICPRGTDNSCQSHEIAVEDEVRKQPNTDDCCPLWTCRARTCDNDERTCADGSLVRRSPSLRCAFNECPFACSDEMLFCPSSGGSLVERERRPSPECNWLDCPHYDPCEDESLSCGENGRCTSVPGTAFNCNCCWGRDVFISGQFLESGACIDFAGHCPTPDNPPRPTVDTHERSFFMDDKCDIFYCWDGKCYKSEGGFEVNFQSLALELTSIVGYAEGYLWFADAEGHLFRTEDGNNLLESDEQWNGILNGGTIRSAIFTVSYRTVVDGEFPPRSEMEHVFGDNRIFSVLGDTVLSVSLDGSAITQTVRDADQCNDLNVWVTDQFLIYISGTHMFKYPWTATGGVDEEAVDKILLCDDYCLVNDIREDCNGNGMCVRETGECLCNFGFTGDKCTVSTALGFDD